MRTIYI